MLVYCSFLDILIFLFNSILSSVKLKFKFTPDYYTRLFYSINIGCPNSNFGVVSFLHDSDF